MDTHTLTLSIHEHTVYTLEAGGSVHVAVFSFTACHFCYTVHVMLTYTCLCDYIHIAVREVCAI